VERAEKQRQLSRFFHRPLEISPKARDSHIPTAWLRGRGKVENQKQVSHFPAPARDDNPCSIEPKIQRKDVGRCAASAAQNLRIILYWKPRSISGSFFD
jgi:hypothetical protein